MRIFLASLCLGLFTSACQKALPLSEFQKPETNDGGVLYGIDDRKDLYQVSDAKMIARAQSTLSLVRDSQLETLSNGRVRLQTESYADAYQLCKQEPFFEQKIAPFCSGFLVGPDLIATAGHCVKSEADCTSIRFVFGYAMTQAGVHPQDFESTEIYSCKQLIVREQVASGADYAIVKLDRTVTGHTPLSIRSSGTLETGTPLTVIGNPAGLPTKVAGGAKVRKIESDYFVANLDTYGGNSGSAVFHTKTGEVEGILVRGDNDYVKVGSCYVSQKNPEEGGRGEDVTKIAKILPYLTVSPPPPQPLGKIEGKAEPKVKIPDQSPTGVESVIEMKEAPQGRLIRVAVNIKHTYRGDLQLTLISPSGTRVILKRGKVKDSGDNVFGTFGANLTSFESLAPLSEEPLAGKWTLHVSDLVAQDTGFLKAWILRMVAPAQ